MWNLPFKQVANRGHCNYQSNGPLLACSWRAIYFLSTIHVAEVPGGATVLRTEEDGSQRIIFKFDRILQRILHNKGGRTR